MGRASRRENTRDIRAIMDIRKKLSKTRVLRWDDIVFSQVKLTKSTAREHARATFPLYGEEEGLKYWTQLKRYFNTHGDSKKKIIGIPYRMHGIDGKIRTYFIEEIAYKENALLAKKHQDIINKGGLKKSQDLEAIQRDIDLKRTHDIELKALLRAAKIGEDR